jgi:hypothetical protein
MVEYIGSRKRRQWHILENFYHSNIKMGWIRFLLDHGTYSSLFLVFENKLASESTFLKLYAYFLQKKPGGETEQQELTYPSLQVYDSVQWLIKLQAKSSLYLFCAAQVRASSLLNQVQ